MDKLRTLIIDDEINLVDSLELMLKEYCPKIDVIAKETSFKAGVESVIKNEPDLIFLDIEMPHGTGFDLLQKIPERKFEVIFVTPYSEYAIKAIKFSALDYILKPVNITELINAVNKVTEQKLKATFHERFQSLTENIQNEKFNKIAIPTSDGLEYIEISKIISIEADGRYSKILLLNGKKLYVSRNIGEFEDLLSENGFYRIHKSHLVNLSHVIKYSRTDGGLVEMSDSTSFPLSRNKKDGFLIQMKNISK